MAKQHTSASKGSGAKVSNIRQAGGANKIGSDLEGAGHITRNKPEGMGVTLRGGGQGSPLSKWQVPVCSMPQGWLAYKYPWEMGDIV